MQLLIEDFIKDKILNNAPNLIKYSDLPSNNFDFIEYLSPVGFKCLTIRFLSVKIFHPFFCARRTSTVSHPMVDLRPLISLKHFCLYALIGPLTCDFAAIFSYDHLPLLKI